MVAVDKIPQPMDHHEKMKLRAAAYRAIRLYPGPIGQVLNREILTYEEFGYRLGGGSVVMQLVDELLKTELPYSSVDNRDPQPRPFFTRGIENA